MNLWHYICVSVSITTMSAADWSIPMTATMIDYGQIVQDHQDVLKVRRLLLLGMESRKYVNDAGVMITSVLIPPSYRRAGEDRYTLQAALPEDNEDLGCGDM